MKRIIAILTVLLFALAGGCTLAEKDTQQSPPYDFAPSKPEAEQEEEQEQEQIPEQVPEPDNPIDEMLNSMSLEEKVGQMFFVQCPENAEQEIKKYGFGGVLLFAWNVEGMTEQQLRQFVEDMQTASATPLFVGTDEEGGTVTRISSNPNIRQEKFKSPRDIYNAGGWNEIENNSLEMARLLKSLGININFAPVCDISTDPSDFIYRRSIGLSPEDTALFASKTVEIFRRESLGSVLKHFPGYGSNGDTHTGRAYDTREIEVFQQADFKPFEAGIAAGATMVMVNHNTVECMDSNLPASLSPEVNRILREELKFSGVVITDDLTMSAIGDLTDSASAAVMAVLAGNDMICCGDYAAQIPAVISAVEDGTIREERIDESVRRILEAKTELGIILGDTDNADRGLQEEI